MQPTEFRARRRHRETHDTFTLELESVNGGAPFAFAPGQFNMLYVFGVGEVPISISGDPRRPGTLVHTTRDVGTVTHALAHVKRGGIVGVRGPFGTGWDVERAVGRDVVILAGGIGMAPLRPVLYAILAERDRFGHVSLLYGARSPEELLFARELRAWRARLDLDVAITVDRATRFWRGSVGVVTTLIPKATFDPGRTTAFICGPEIMMRYSILELQNRGVPDDAIVISMERNMKCAIGFCGHCQWGPQFICKDGPVFQYDRVRGWFMTREV
jgi:NAD(P)H-flavin reductase